MKTVTRYECEVCGLEHITTTSAHACESCKPPPLPYKAGHEVIIRRDRDDFKTQTCTGTHLSSSIFAHYAAMETIEGIALYKEKDCWQPDKFHNWVIDIDKEIYMGDEHFSSVVGVYSVMRRIRLYAPEWPAALKQRKLIKPLEKKLDYTSLDIDWDTVCLNGVNALMAWEDLDSHQTTFSEFDIKCQILPIPKMT